MAPRIGSRRELLTADGGLPQRAHLARWMAAAVSSVFLSLGALAQSEAPCELPKTSLYEDTARLCDGGMPGASRSQCSDRLAELAAIEDPSLDEALALAYGRSFAAKFELPSDPFASSEDYHAAEAAALLAGRELLKPFVERAPDDPMVVRAYAYFHMLEDEEYAALLRRTLTLDPTCSDAAYFLSMTVGASDDEAVGEESGRYLTHGYEHSEGTWKLLFAREKYDRLAYRSVAEAEAFRDQVEADMASRQFPLDPENRASSLEVLCNGNGFSLRLHAPCENAIRELAGRDRLANVPLGDDVLDAMLSLSAFADNGELDGARVDQMLLKLLEAEPEWLRAAQFYVVYSVVLGATSGHDAEIDALRRALDLDPRSGEIGLDLAGAMERGGRPPHDIAEVYRHVIANSDGRAIEEGMPADHYVERATKYLRELEAEEEQGR